MLKYNRTKVEPKLEEQTPQTLSIIDDIGNNALKF